MNDITKRTKICQVEPKRKRIKGEISRPNERFIANWQRDLLKAGRKRKRQIIKHTRFNLSHVPYWHLELLNYLIKIAANKGTVGREYLAERFNCCVDTISAVVCRLEKWGFFKITQIFEEYNTYAPGPLIKDPHIRDDLLEFLPALKFIVCLTLATALNIRSEKTFQEERLRERSSSFSFKKEKQHEKESQQRETYNRLAHEARLASNKAYIDQLFMSDNAPKKGALPMSIDLFRPLLGSLSSLELTDHGKAELEAYPDEAIRLGDARLARSLKAGAAVASPLGLIISVARAYCKENNIQPDSRRTGALMRELNIDPSSPKFSAVKLSKQTASSAVKTTVNNWKAELVSQAKPYHDEQEELPNLTREQRKARIDLTHFKKLSPSMQEMLIKIHPFPDASELIAELLNTLEQAAAAEAAAPIQPELAVETTADFSQVERAAWIPLIPKLSNYSQEHRAISLKSRGMERFIPLVEQLIEQTYGNDTIWQEV